MRLSTRTVQRAVVCLWIAGPFGIQLGGSALALGPDAATDGSPPAATNNQPGGTPTPGASPAATPAPRPSDVTSRVGLTFNDPAIAAALDLFQSGKHTEALQSLTKLLSDRAQSDTERQRELQLALVMLQIRLGDKNLEERKFNFANGKSLAAKYGRDWPESSARTRAQVLSLVADHAVKDGTKKFEKLGPDAAWLEYLATTARTLETQISNESERAKNAGSGDRWANAVDCMRKIETAFEQRLEIKLEQDRLPDLARQSSEEMKAAARRINDRLGDLINQVYARQQELQSAGPRTKGVCRDNLNKAIQTARTCRDALDRIIECHRNLAGKFRSEVRPLLIHAHDVPAL